MGKTETLILQKGWRGMDLLAQHLDENFCTHAAEAVKSWPRGNILLTTGFYVCGHAESDGPPGTLLLCYALRELGFTPVIVTDEICRGYFEREQFAVHYLPVDADDARCKDILDQVQPVGMIAIERCGKNILDRYENAAGGVFKDNTAPCDRLFELADVPTIGIGDGGNEVGMGKLADVIRAHLPLVPCRVATDHLIVATVSNWGAIALAGELGKLPTEEEFLHAYHLALEFGYVDGFTGENVLTEDKFPLEVGLQLLQDLRS